MDSLCVALRTLRLRVNPVFALFQRWKRVQARRVGDRRSEIFNFGLHQEVKAVVSGREFQKGFGERFRCLFCRVLRAR